MVVPAASFAMNPSWESDWGRAVYDLVRRAADAGQSVTVAADERLYTPQEAAIASHVSRMTILRRIEDGTIRAAKKGAHWRIAESELERYRLAMLADTAAVMANDF